jgi:hypothetical protein
VEFSLARVLVFWPVLMENYAGSKSTKLLVPGHLKPSKVGLLPLPEATKTGNYSCRMRDWMPRLPLRHHLQLQMLGQFRRPFLLQALLAYRKMRKTKLVNVCGGAMS